MISDKTTTVVSPAPAYALTILVLSLAFVVAQLDVSIANIALPQIADTYKVDISVSQWIVDSYTLVFAVLILSAGNLSDLFGAMRLFQFGMLIFGMSSVVCGLATSSFVLIAARVFQGVGAATMIPSSLAILNQAFADARKKEPKQLACGQQQEVLQLQSGPSLGVYLSCLVTGVLYFSSMLRSVLCPISLLLALKNEANWRNCSRWWYSNSTHDNCKYHSCYRMCNLNHLSKYEIY